MSQITLKASETRILLDAAARDGLILFPGVLKESTRQRIAGLFAKHALSETGTESELRLSPAGYRAVGLQPPQVARAPGEKRGAKRDLVLELLGRGEGASLSELVAATGWLPHTTRAALSRFRSGGQVLAKSKRDDGQTCYRIGRPEPVAPSRRSRRPRTDANAGIAA